MVKFKTVWGCLFVSFGNNFQQPRDINQALVLLFFFYCSRSLNNQTAGQLRSSPKSYWALCKGWHGAMALLSLGQATSRCAATAWAGPLWWGKLVMDSSLEFLIPPPLSPWDPSPLGLQRSGTGSWRIACVLWLFRIKFSLNSHFTGLPAFSLGASVFCL